MQVIKFLWKGKHKVAACGHIFGIAAVNAISGEDWRIAQIFEPAAAVWASPVDSSDPGNAHACADLQFGGCGFHDIANNLVSGN